MCRYIQSASASQPVSLASNGCANLSQQPNLRRRVEGGGKARRGERRADCPVADGQTHGRTERTDERADEQTDMDERMHERTEDGWRADTRATDGWTKDEGQRSD